MYPYWNMPYWYNYYYFYKYPSLMRCDDEDDKCEDKHTHDYRNEADRQMPQVPQGYTPGAPTQFPIGNFGHYGATEGMPPGGMPQTQQPSQTQQPTSSSDGIMNNIMQNEPDIMKSLTSYGVPYQSALQLMSRIIQATLRYSGQAMQ